MPTAAETTANGASTSCDAGLPEYGEFVARLYETGVLDDAWHDGAPRFRLQGVVLPPARARALRRAAERVGAVYQELVDLVWEEPRWLDDYFCLTPYQKLMWFAAQGRWHGIARADLFVCADGRIRCCEVNSDTPSGEAETVLLNRLLHPYHGAVQDPNRALPDAFWRMLVASHGGRVPGTIGIVYPTEMTEDLSMIAIYREWLEARGCRVVLGSPFNLHECAAGVGMFGEPLDILIRHYKTDWWGERQVVWSDAEPYPDDEPLSGPLRLLLAAEYAGRVTVVNPFRHGGEPEQAQYGLHVGRAPAVLRRRAALDRALYPRNVPHDPHGAGRTRGESAGLGAEIGLRLRERRDDLRGVRQRRTVARGGGQGSAGQLGVPALLSC